jgi:hypothetical protein
MKPVGTYRVVGLRADGTRTVLLEGASPREAARVRIQVLNANAFPDVLIERENGHEGDNTKNTSPPRRP